MFPNNQLKCSFEKLFCQKTTKPFSVHSFKLQTGSLHPYMEVCVQCFCFIRCFIFILKLHVELNRVIFELLADYVLKYNVLPLTYKVDCEFVTFSVPQDSKLLCVICLCPINTVFRGSLRLSVFVISTEVETIAVHVSDVL